MIYYSLNIKEKKKINQGLNLDFYQAQNKYRQKQFRSILNYIIKLLMIIIAVFIGWWLGNRDKLVLIQENEKLINDFNDCLLYTSPSPRDISGSRMPSSA